MENFLGNIVGILVYRFGLSDRRGSRGLAGVERRQDGKKQVNKEKERVRKWERIYPQPVTPGTTNVFSVVELITPERAENACIIAWQSQDNTHTKICK